MTYFNRRNKYTIEYSGHEEISPSLRKRIAKVIEKYVGRNVSLGDNWWWVESSEFEHAVRQEFPNSDPYGLIDEGEFYEVFTIVEIFLDMAKALDYERRIVAENEMSAMLYLSGSVYSIKERRVVLSVEDDLATKLEEAKEIFSPYETWYKTFFEAVGDMLGRRSKASDVVKNIFVASEGYLKQITGKTRFSDSVGELDKKGVLNREQKAIMDKLYAYRSDAAGTVHAGNSAEPTELEALWYLETMLAQLRSIHRKLGS